MVDRITQLVADFNRTGELKGYDLGLSIGVAGWHEGISFDQVLDSADREMYKVRAAAGGKRQAAACN